MDAYFDELIEYVLEELPEDRRLIIRAHLDSGCVECNAELRQLQEAFHLLPAALPSYELNPTLKNNLQDSINAESVRELGLQSGSHHISHYKILRKLGTGGMGEVFLAEDTKLGRSTALKIIRPEAATNLERKKRFLREARAAAFLSHPGIATIYEVGEDLGLDYIAMEYVEGNDLSQIISGKPLDPTRVIQIGRQIAEALAEAHQRGILHRDLKPENIQISGGDQVKILDFGLAKFMESRMEDDYLTTSDRVLGTIPYMSPEQVSGMPMDARSDLFSLGSIFYEMATGKSPFAGKTPAETLENVLRRNPPLLSTLNPGIPSGLQKVIYKCLQKDPSKRYASAREVADDLQFVRAAETIDLEKPFEESVIRTIRIAVLYFENLSEEKESDYFRAGMTEDIITELSKVRAWEVRPRTQVVRYKDQSIDIREIGRELGVTHILHGSIRKAGSRLRISAHLVDSASASSVWGERYDRDLSDVFEIQAEIAQKIATALRVHLTQAEQKQIQKRQTDNLQAYDHYLRGRESMFRLTREGIETAITYFEKAIQMDAQYAMAYSGLAQAYALKLSFFGGSEQLADQAIENSKRALKLNPDQSQAEAALGLSYLLKRMSAEAIEACKRAIELNPNDAFAQWISGRLSYRLNEYQEAIERFQKTVELVPDFYTAYSDLAQAYENLGQHKQAQEMRRRTIHACKAYLKSDPDEARAYIFLATASSWLGDKKTAFEAGAKAEQLSSNDPVMMYNLACLYSILNEGDRAVEWLQKSVKNGRKDFEWMKRDPALKNIRNHPGYLELIR
jgi:serine/threonine protein kinase/Flp pilus assembly protein TadD